MGRPAMKLIGGWEGGGLELDCGRPILALDSALVHSHNNLKQLKQNE